jgi:hypothetical protein
MADTNISDIFKKENNPIKKFANSLADKLAAKAEDKLVGALSDALAKVGLGQGSGKSIASQLGDAIVADLAAEFFGALGKDINRATKEEIELARGTIDANVDAPNVLEPENQELGSEVLRFPASIGDYHMRLEIKQYSRPASNEVAEMTVRDVIILPLPRTLEDRHEISYEGHLELGIVGAIGANASNPANMGTVTNALADNGMAGLAYAAQGVAGGGGLGNQVFSIMQQMAGAIPNPHVSALFKSVTLRRHRFDWLLAPNNEEESETLRKVLLRLKQAALPSFTKNKNLLEMPEMIKIKLMPWGSLGNQVSEGLDRDIPNNLYVFKHCMIDNISVNYAPDSPTFFAGGDPNNPAPSFVLLSLTLLEIEYFTADDYGREGTLSADDIVKNVTEDILKNVAGMELANTSTSGTGANSTPTTSGAPASVNGTKVTAVSKYVNNSTGDAVYVTGSLVATSTKYIYKSNSRTNGRSSKNIFIVSSTPPVGFPQAYEATASTQEFTLGDNGITATPTNK